jgi:pyridoxamine 5'-phosphate oxidase
MSNVKISDIRINYAQASLDETIVGLDPLLFFQKWLDEALRAEVNEPTAMSLSTVFNGQPSSRIVLLKGLEDGKLKFFTNYSSRKAEELAQNPKASLLFFWAELERQVRIEGSLEKLSQLESEQYFHSRPRESQIGAYTSQQSKVIQSREELEKRYIDLVEKFQGINPIPLPDNWGGYAMIPETIEFWQGRPSRLHDRIRFMNQKDGWKKERLSP